MRKISLFLGFGLLAATMLSGAVLFVLWRSLPDYTGTRVVSGLSSSVKILRTEHAVPHIFAEDDAGVFFGLGYAHAQDRIWQMEISRRTAKGRLSELLGPETLRTDELLLRMGLYEAAAKSVTVQDEYTLQTLENYSAGVNAFIVETRGLGRAAPE